MGLVSGLGWVQGLKGGKGLRVLHWEINRPHLLSVNPARRTQEAAAKARQLAVQRVQQLPALQKARTAAQPASPVAAALQKLAARPGFPASPGLAATVQQAAANVSSLSAISTLHAGLECGLGDGPQAAGARALGAGRLSWHAKRQAAAAASVNEVHERIQASLDCWTCGACQLRNPVSGAGGTRDPALLPWPWRLCLPHPLLPVPPPLPLPRQPRLLAGPCWIPWMQPKPPCGCPQPAAAAAPAAPASPLLLRPFLPWPAARWARHAARQGGVPAAWAAVPASQRQSLLRLMRARAEQAGRALPPRRWLLHCSRAWMRQPSQLSQGQGARRRWRQRAVQSLQRQLTAPRRATKESRSSQRMRRQPRAVQWQPRAVQRQRGAVPPT